MKTTATDHSPDQIDSNFNGGGEMGRRMSSLDWNKTGLGPPDQWERSLKTAVRIVLTCPQPMFIWWTGEFYNLYNDAYVPVLGKKHPQALARPAREIWGEIWDEIGPRAESALLEDEGTFDEDLLLIMNRHGFSEETYYTFSYNPFPNDEGGTGGVICACTEETRRVIGDRRIELLRSLAVAGSNAESVFEICSKSCEALLANARDLPFAMIYLRSEPGGELVLAGSAGVAAGDPIAPDQISVEDFNALWSIDGNGDEEREPVSISDRFQDIPTGAWDVSPNEVVLLPIGATSGDLSDGVLVAGLNPYRPYDDDYSGFMKLVSGQISAGISRAEAFEEEKRRAESLAELDRATTTFFSNVSHELRTPLTLILGPISELRNRAGEGGIFEEAADILDAAHRNGKRLMKLVNTFLDFTRIEAGRADALFESMDLAALTTDLASTFESAMDRAGLSYEVDCPTLSERVYVDRDMWEKVVLNLVSNAFKYTLNGYVKVTLRAEDGEAVLRIEDSGTGIPEDELPRLFERFHRVEGSTGRSQEGSGIGLALVKELVALHHGTISVESKQGQGSAFTVRVPLGSEHLDPARIAANRQLIPTATGASVFVEEALRWLPEDGAGADSSYGRRAVLPPEVRAEGARAHVLLADDSADMRQYVERLLVSDFGITAVADGVEAYKIAIRARPDLIISDVMMPGLSGIELIRKLRANPATAGIPVILLSARMGEEARIEGIEAGADDYITKPFSARELIARVGGALNLASVRREAIVREEELKARTAHVLESITEGYASLDSDFVYTALNDRAEHILDRSRDELVGQCLFDVYPDMNGSLVEEKYREAMDKRVPVHFEFYYESWQRWFEIGAYPEDGGGLGTYFRDITHRAHTEAILEGQKRALERVIHGAELSHVLEILTLTIEELSGGNALASILLLDENGRHLRKGAAPSLPADYNRAIDGLEIGPNVGSCGTAAYQQECVIVSDIETDPLWADFKDLALKHGLRSCWSSPIQSAKGEVLGTFAVYHRTTSTPSAEDMTTVDLLKNTAAIIIERDRERQQRQAIAESLRDADRRKDEFLATLAHELRNPLAPIRTGLEVLRIGNPSAEETERVRAIMERQTEQMVRLIDDLLDVSRITRGKLKLRKVLIPLREVIRDAVAATQPFIDEAKHRLEVLEPDASLKIECDPHRLAQVLSNLLTNASKYTPDGGRITVRTIPAPEGDEVVIEVKDNGEGIAKELQANIFEMFAQIENIREKSPSGLGIGLTLVKSLVDMHGGSIRVESEGVGKGSAFLVTLPLSPERLTADAAHEESVNTMDQETVSDPESKIRILVVDDKATAAETLAMYFEMQGFEVSTANDGEEAIGATRTWNPDIILMDIGMPRMDGKEAARHIRRLPGGDRITMVALTGWGQEKDRKETAAAGFDRHLVKPVEPTILRELIQEWKEGHGDG